ncbi:type II secretion system protein GspD [Granulicella sp. S156]|uniref:type II secretion system protein GspD n=1 Tax=Granulicella sp. S156 TaxID=1747224 RepID=UPI00131C8701|nr:type II secretory protein PulD [Granulicella sp. S156]
MTPPSAAQLDPGDHDYELALHFTQEERVTQLIHEAEEARLVGALDHAKDLLSEARTLDPTNPAVMEHSEQNETRQRPDKLTAHSISFTLAGPIEFEPSTGVHSFHLRGNVQDIVRSIYGSFGIAVIFDPSVSIGTAIRFDVDDVDFNDATRILAEMNRLLFVPIETKTALIAKDTKENRDALMPLVEETIYMPGLSQDQMLDLASVARNIFGIKQVTANAHSGSMVLRGEEDILRLVNATYADMMDRGSEVLIEVKLYEIDKSSARDIGLTPPSSASAFSLASTGQTLINSNQALLNQAIASGYLTLTGNASTNELNELGFLIAAGVPGTSQFTSLLGVFGSFGGGPLAGVSVASGATFNLLLNTSEARTLDAIQIRASNHQTATFRSGTRYPIITSTYTTTSSQASQAAALGVSSAVIAQNGGAPVTTPNIQYEDLGITLKITPQVMRDDEIQLALDLKIAALAGGSINSIPILNSHALASTITVPAGETTMLASVVSKSEARMLDGVPDLNDLPGFQGTDRNTNGTSTELLLTITPHIVRPGSIHLNSRRMTVPNRGEEPGN